MVVPFIQILGPVPYHLVFQRHVEQSAPSATPVLSIPSVAAVSRTSLVGGATRVLTALKDRLMVLMLYIAVCLLIGRTVTPPLAHRWSLYTI